MEEPKFNWKRLLITLGFVFLASAVVGGTTWYVMDTNQKKDQEQFEKQIRELEEQRDQEKTEAKESSRQVVMKTYYNDSFGFSFKYPASYSIKEEGTLTAGTVQAGSITLSDSRPGNPTLTLLFNPDGLGGCNLDRNDYGYTTQIKDGRVVILNKELQTNSPCEFAAPVSTDFSIGTGEYVGNFKNAIYG